MVKPNRSRPPYTTGSGKGPRLWLAAVLVGQFIAAITPSLSGAFAAEAALRVDMLSPKLRQFLNEHAPAWPELTNALSKAFTNRAVQIYYFYSEDDSTARAYHYYPNGSVVGIGIRENQQPSDEFISLLFEVVNSQGEVQFGELCKKAETGTITRTAFAREMLRVEFEAVKVTRGALARLKLTQSETAKSHYYAHFLECPSRFEEFLTYTEKISLPERDPIKEFELKYDSLRKP